MDDDDCTLEDDKADEVVCTLLETLVLGNGNRLSLMEEGLEEMEDDDRLKEAADEKLSKAVVLVMEANAELDELMNTVELLVLVPWLEAVLAGVVAEDEKLPDEAADEALGD